MAVCFLKETFMFENYKIVVVEARDFLLKRFNITEEIIVSENIDTRIMTCIAKFNESMIISTDSEKILDFNYIIYVFDYDKLTEDNSINQAIISHELAHIYYPPKTIQQEIECDIYATKQVSSQAVYNYLDVSIREMKKIGKSTRELEIRKITIEALL